MIPALIGENEPSTAQLRFLERTDILVYTRRCESSFMRNSFLKKTVPLWNTLPKNLKTKYIKKLKLIYNYKEQDQSFLTQTT